MRPQEASEDADTPRDVLLEAAFAQFVQQAQAPPAFAARVRARAALLHTEERPQSWRRRAGAWLVGAGEPWDSPAADRQAASWWGRPHPGQGWTVVLATCLVLSLLGNVWLGMQRGGQDRGAAPDTGPARPRGDVPGTSGVLRLAFADEVREEEVRTLLVSLRATILAGPSPQGSYTVRVPLAGLLPRLRGTAGVLNTAAAMRLLLEELRTHPSVRFVEPVSPVE